MTKKSYIKKKVVGLLGVVRKIKQAGAAYIRGLVEGLIMLSLTERKRVYSYNNFQHLLLVNVVTTFTVVKTAGASIGAFVPVSGIILGGIVTKLGYAWATSPTGLVSLGFTGGLSLFAIGSQIGTVALGIGSIIWGIRSLFKLGRETKAKLLAEENRKNVVSEFKLISCKFVHFFCLKQYMEAEISIKALNTLKTPNVTKVQHYMEEGHVVTEFVNDHAVAFKEEIDLLLAFEHICHEIYADLRNQEIKLELLSIGMAKADFNFNEKEVTNYREMIVENKIKFSGLEKELKLASEVELAYLSDEEEAVKNKLDQLEISVNGMADIGQKVYEQLRKLQGDLRRTNFNIKDMVNGINEIMKNVSEKYG